MAVRLWVVVLTLAALLVVDRREWAEPGFSVAWYPLRSVCTRPQELQSTNSFHTLKHRHTPGGPHTWAQQTQVHTLYTPTATHTHTYQQTHQGAPSGWFHAHWSHAGTFLNRAPPWSPAGSSRAPGSLAASESLCALPSSLLHSPCDHVAESLDCPQTSSLVYGTDQVTYDNDCQLCLTRM
ncbi:serine protease inhibitor Kazal-type 4 [Equus asinus]|uniref:serine protease inhibitor Kazal-type 4 n=1 Tax=Equus asinus TaxID=9793 RepID=UPI00071A2A4F|nr:serine protease inhibitor Kazal-type 4 [Equus asinus]